MPIHARSQVSYLLLYMLIGALVLEALRAIAFGELTKSVLVIASVLTLVTLVSWWIKAVQSRRWIEIDPQTRQVTIHAVSAFFSPIQNHYPLNQFSALLHDDRAFPKEPRRTCHEEWGRSFDRGGLFPGHQGPVVLVCANRS